MSVREEFNQMFPEFTEHKPVKEYGSQSASAVSIFVVDQLNTYGGFYLNALMPRDKASSIMKAWATSLQVHTPSAIIATLERFLDGNARLSSRYDCPMPRSPVEFVTELRNAPGNAQAYDGGKNVSDREILSLAWDNAQGDDHLKAVAKVMFMILARDTKCVMLQTVCFQKLEVKSLRQIDNLELTDYEMQIFDKQATLYAEFKRELSNYGNKLNN
jgi:hypothetical protein